MIMCGSSLSDGNRHDPNNLPILLGGKGGGRIQSGRHIASPRNTPLCNLYLAMLDCMGIRVAAVRRQHRNAARLVGVKRLRDDVGLVVLYFHEVAKRGGEARRKFPLGIPSLTSRSVG